MIAGSYPALSFSTLACPEWGPEEIIEQANALGFDGIEWRGGDDGHVSTEWSQSRRREVRSAMEAAGVRPLAVTSYAMFASPDKKDRDANALDLFDHLKLAADLGAPFVRTFLGWRTDETTTRELAQRIAGALRPIADHAASLSVSIVIEPHDDFVRAAYVRDILEQLSHPSVGAIWDIGNAWAAGETPETTFAALSPYLRYVQVKDGAGTSETWRLTALGDGDVPIAAALALLDAPLPVSIEWERAWHDYLEPPQVALPRAAAFMRRVLAGNDPSGLKAG